MSIHTILSYLNETEKEIISFFGEDGKNHISTTDKVVF